MIFHSQLSLIKEQWFVISCCLMCLLLPSYVWYSTSTNTDETFSLLNALNEQCQTLKKVALGQELNRKLILESKNKDPLFLQRQVESYPLLQQEHALLAEEISSSCLPIPRERKDRLSFLSSHENKLSFIEGHVHQTDLLKETLEVQSKQVEMDQQDLEHVLSLLEGTTGDQKEDKKKEALQQRPCLIIENFELERKNRPLQEVWQVKSRLLKREFNLGSMKK